MQVFKVPEVEEEKEGVLHNELQHYQSHYIENSGVNSPQSARRSPFKIEENVVSSDANIEVAIHVSD